MAYIHIFFEGFGIYPFSIRSFSGKTPLLLLSADSDYFVHHHGDFGAIGDSRQVADLLPERIWGDDSDPFVGLQGYHSWTCGERSDVFQ